jgi:hypothetical protein
MLGLSSLVTLSHATDPKLAAKRPVEFMWQKDNPVFSFLSDAPSKRFKHQPPAFSRGSKSSQLMIEYHCGSKKIQMTLTENTADTLLKNIFADKLPLAAADSKVASVLTQSQMERLQYLMDPYNKDLSNQDSRLDHYEEDLWDTPLAAAAFNVEEERMFENAKMFANHGNGCFTTKELLSIRLLSLMREIGAPLKIYGRIVSLLKR